MAEPVSSADQYSSCLLPAEKASIDAEHNNIIRHGIEILETNDMHQEAKKFKSHIESAYKLLIQHMELERESVKKYTTAKEDGNTSPIQKEITTARAYFDVDKETQLLPELKRLKVLLNNMGYFDLDQENYIRVDEICKALHAAEALKDSEPETAKKQKDLAKKLIEKERQKDLARRRQRAGK